jgi:hypothetical protein
MLLHKKGLLFFTQQPFYLFKDISSICKLQA